MGIYESLFGKSGEMKAMPTMDPQQQQMFSQYMNQLGGMGGMGFDQLRSMLSGEDKAFEQSAMSNFNQSIVPNLAEQFAGVGGRSSSAFNQALGGAGAGLAEQLALHKSGLQQQGMGQLFNMMQSGMQQPTFNWQQIPGTQGALAPLMSGLGSALGQVGGTALGAGMLGAITPGVSGFGGGLSKLFGG